MRRGFTLLEVIAVVVIASTASAVLLTSLVGADRHAATLGAISRWQDMDRRGRMFAQSDRRAMILRIDHEERVLSLHPTNANDNSAALSKFDLPSRLAITFVDGESQPLPHVEIDRVGRSIDYTAIFTIESSPIHRHVCGLTGWVVQKDERP